MLSNRCHDSQCTFSFLSELSFCAACAEEKSITVQHANECKTKSETIDFTNSITKCIRRRPIQKFLRSRMLTETKIELIYHFKPMFLKYMNIFIKGHESDTLNATMQRLCYLPKKFEPSVIRGPS